MADISDSGSFNLGLANIASQNYGPAATSTQALQGANTQNIQQTTQAQTMQNKIMAARMPLILSQLHDESVGAGDQSGVGGQENSAGGAEGLRASASMHERLQQAQDNSGSAEPSILNQAGIDQGMRDKYFVQQITPQEQEALRKAWLVDPTDQYGMGPKRVMQMRELRIAQQTQNSQKDSRDDFDALHAVTDAPEGQAMSVLERSHPETYAAIKRQFKNDPNEDRDEEDQARLFASHAAGAVHQYTGRKAVKDDAGVYRDEETGIPIPGVEKVGLSTDQFTKLAHEAITPSVEMDDGLGGKIKVAPWKAAQMGGAKNINGPGDWMMVRASQTGLPGAAATLSGNSAQKQEARATAQTALAKVQKEHDAAPAPTNGEPKPVNGVGTATNSQGQIDPKLTDALHDTKYAYKPTNNGEPYTPQIGHTPPPPVLEDMKNQTAARNALAKDTNQGIGAASAALTMYQAANDILAKGRYDGGAWDAKLSKEAGKYLPVGWQNAAKTGDYQELAKMLGTAALQSGKGIFAKMTQMEAKMLTTELSPAPGMQPEAMRDMIAKGMKMAQYAVDSAKRVPHYLHTGLDANEFPTWNQEHFPMEKETIPTPAKPNAAGAASKYSDAQVRAYMSKHGLKDEQATRKALGL
jgi:hypothetical protein